MRGFWVLAALAALTGGAARADVVWSIGRPDRDYRDLAIAGNYGAFGGRFGGGVRYRVGASSAAKDWPFIHPGPVDQWAGGRTHRFEVAFAMADPGSIGYRLVIDLVNTHYASAPALQVEVNGRLAGRYRLPVGSADASLTDARAGRPSSVVLPIAASAFQAGENRIALTVVAGSWLLYDALRLEDGAELPTTPRLFGLSAASTGLIRRDRAGLRQIVRLSVNNSGAAGQGRVRVSGLVSADVPLDLPTGSADLDLPIPPPARSGRLAIVVEAGGSRSETTVDVRPARRWVIFLAPTSHTDIGYTDLQDRTIQRHLENTLTGIGRASDDAGFRWNLEVAYQAQRLHEARPELAKELDAQIRAGRIGVQGLYLNMLTGLCTGEELIRVVEQAQRMGMAGGYSVPLAGLTDVPTAVGTLPSILAGAGVRYFIEGINEDRGPVFAHAPIAMRQSPFWWVGMDGQRVLALLAQGYAQTAGLGAMDGVEALERNMPGFLARFDRADYPGDAVLAYGGVSDNQPIDTRYMKTVREWNERWAYPKVVVGCTSDFFRHVEKTVGARLPVFRGDSGSYWEDGAGSSAHETALARWSATRLQEADAWRALAGVKASEAGSAAAWQDTMFYDEHTWGAYCSIGDPSNPFTLAQWNYKAAYATRAADAADALWRSARRLAGGRPAAAAVTNGLGWPRAIGASLPLPAGWSRAIARDGRTGDALPTTISGGRVQTIVPAVPAFGAASVRLEPMKARIRQIGLIRTDADGVSFATDRLRLRFDPATGALASLRDAKGREWAGTSHGWGFGQFVEVQGGAGGMIHPFEALPKDLATVTHSRTVIKLVDNGAALGVIRVRRQGEGAPDVDSYWILRADGDLEMLNVIHKPAQTRKEAGYFVFPFRLADARRARAWVELPYGVTEADQEQMPGACREWFATPGFAAVSDGRTTACLATPHAPLLTLGDVWRGTWRPKLGATGGVVLSYAYNNYWHTNYKASQSGDMVFSYSFRFADGAFDPAAAARFSAAKRADMADPRRGGESEPWRAAMQEATAVAPGAMRLATVRALSGAALIGGVLSRDGKMLIRLYNPTGTSTTARVGLEGRFAASAELTDLVGRRRAVAALAAGGGSFTAPVPARGLTTVAVRLRPADGRAAR